MNLMATTTAKVTPPERFPGGKLKPDDTPRGHPPVLIKRLVEHGLRLGADPRLTSQLGLLHLHGILTETEYLAGMFYAEDVGRYERSQGMPRRDACSPSFEGGFGESGLHPDYLIRIDPDVARKTAEKIKRRVQKAKKAYNRVQSCIPMGASAVLDRVCCDDRWISNQHHEGLKYVLGLLAKNCYGAKIRRSMVAEAEPVAKRRKKTTVGDARLLAEAACDAIEAWFARETGTIQAFDIGAGRHKARRISAYGVWAKNGSTPLTHFIDVRLNGLLPAVLDAQLVKAAIAKGWAEASKRRVG